MSNYTVNDIKRYKMSRRKGDGMWVEVHIPVRESIPSRDQKSQKCYVNSRLLEELSALRRVHQDHLL